MLSDEFKAAVGKFPTGVTVISTSHGEKLCGFTANSFVSVSLTPPLISFCLNKKASSFSAFKSSDFFAINILSSDQAHISQKFSRNSEDKFINTNYELGEYSNAPLISGSVCFIECKKYDEISCGDHFIFVGEVIKTSISNDKQPLVYYARSYKEMR